MDEHPAAEKPPGLVERVRQSRLPAPTTRRRIRQQAQASLRDMAGELRVTPMTILRWERGDAVPRLDHAIAYRELLDALKEATQ